MVGRIAVTVRPQPFARSVVGGINRRLLGVVLRVWPRRSNKGINRRFSAPYIPVVCLFSLRTRWPPFAVGKSSTPIWLPSTHAENGQPGRSLITIASYNCTKHKPLRSQLLMLSRKTLPTKKPSFGPELIRFSLVSLFAASCW